MEANPELPQLCLFVEGTTTNGTSLLNFKRGAFFGKRAVVPSAIRYWGPLFIPTMDIIPQVPHFLILHSQLFATMTVLEFPGVELKPELKNAVTWEEYAAAVHDIMRDGMGVPSSSLTFRDKQDYLQLIFDKHKKE